MASSPVGVFDWRDICDQADHLHDLINKTTSTPKSPRTKPRTTHAGVKCKCEICKAPYTEVLDSLERKFTSHAQSRRCCARTRVEGAHSKYWGMWQCSALFVGLEAYVTILENNSTSNFFLVFIHQLPLPSRKFQPILALSCLIPKVEINYLPAYNHGPQFELCLHFFELKKKCVWFRNTT